MFLTLPRIREKISSGINLTGRCWTGLQTPSSKTSNVLDGVANPVQQKDKKEEYPNTRRCEHAKEKAN